MVFYGFLWFFKGIPTTPQHTDSHPCTSLLGDTSELVRNRIDDVFDMDITQRSFYNLRLPIGQKFLGDFRFFS